MPQASADCEILVFAKAPVPGEVKTRLIPALGAQGAARLHSQLVEHALRKAIASGIGPVTLWSAGDCGHPAFELWRREFGVSLEPQKGADLGERMLAAFKRNAGRPALLIGSDCPSITLRQLRDCADALRGGADAVFLAAEDGGYGLVGMREPLDCIFRNIPWGTSDVMAVTSQRLTDAKLNWRQLATIWDIDRPEDLVRLGKSGLIDMHTPPVA